MLGYAYGATRHGADVQLIRVQADVGPGFPRFTMVGLPDSSVSEAKARVRSAFHHAGLPFPKGRITVNLQPAGVKKQGSWLDLAIAVAILRASSALPSQDDPTIFVAELALDGALIPQAGLTAIGLRMREEGWSSLCISADQSLPWPLEEQFRVVRAKHLQDVVAELRHPRPSSERPSRQTAEGRWADGTCFPLVGHRVETRLLAICAAGRHALLLVGSPGVGKTTLADAFVHLLPDLTEDEALEVAAWHEIVNPAYSFTLRPPVRRPHHTASVRTLLGGGRFATPGEVTLAHRGILILDEFLEFSHAALNALREPLDRGSLECMANGKPLVLPASFTLVATTNPCPCGYRGYGDCTCPETEIRRYWSRCPGPVLDRIDIIHHVNREVGQHVDVEPFHVWEKRVSTAAAILARCPRPGESAMTGAGQKALARACERLRASERDRQKIAMIASTIAALEGRDEVLAPDVDEAIIWRNPGFASPVRNAMM
ncbi:YifB family Mg chelatase-like AAA ATPase [Alicyclobacillus fructus]|uniref:YifB family Mg chelatase-like AAA ATPase n=1 Tax=Alicyclobacillus fructus TaxID=2816082 RepID=UPI001A9047EF|nr:ATP-binding protein [Alicyclobacillus fructus]